MANNELLLATKAFINLHPERHEQQEWASDNEDGLYANPNVCGSSACFAGWASVFAGWFQVMTDGGNGRRYGTDLVVHPLTNEQSSMSEVGERELGLSSEQADDLFNGNNSLDCINEMVDALVADGNADLASIREKYNEECDCSDCTEQIALINA